MEKKRMELTVKPFATPDAIEFNFEELKAALTEKVKDYETALYSDDQIKDAKADKASLNRLKKALNDERLRMEKEYMAPFTEFKSKINEIIAIIDKPVQAIDTQIKAYDEMRREEKAIAIREYMHSFDLPYEIDVNLIWNERWLNATFADKDIKEEIHEKVHAILEDVKTLEALEEDQAAAILRYKKDLDLRAALAEVTAARQRREQLKRIEEERKAAKEIPAPEKKPEVKQEVKLPEPEEMKAEEKPEGQWVNFSAYLTVETARKLKTFLNENNIEFKRI